MEDNQNSVIRGEPLSVDELLILATVDNAAIISALDWWDETATDDWIGVLDKEPVDA